VTTGFLESRTRVSIFLPHLQKQNAKAFLAVLRYLETQRKAKIEISGYTTSNRMLQVYKGTWWGKEPKDPPETERWIGEYVAHLIIDYEHATDEIEASIGRLRKKVMDCYREFENPQTDLWIVAQPVMRFIAENNDASSEDPANDQPAT
jgi:hypothetical protein